ncbi:secretion protein [Nocardia cyriacigeorgica]|uniref:Secretion protein n=1 Tax=Nocardia cyriacigeorgica TaxID=135487 RepID=A0A6P1D6R1_9NOCA|nr:CAP family protein [Nocardia cyriacigeorgica]NEW41470.1 secretion protein [Nocardia cyriacigeorgica]NEW45758.1 secretion protein [Nocardia cyriacigeorgica]NEW51982.1 secretion protein [Nocardia cyriacigeorgica]
MRTGRMLSITTAGVFAALVAIAGPAAGQGFPQYAHTGLDAHNNYRARHGSPAMSLTQDLVTRAGKCAQYYADKGTIDHSCPHKNGAGENLFMATGGTSDAVHNVEVATQVWYDEIADYDYNNPGFANNTGHFTQLVWKASTRLGVGFSTKNNKHIVVALYLEHGNVTGRSNFEQNVPRPR